MRSYAGQPSLKIDNARFIVTVDSQRRIIRGGTVLVSGNSIVGVGKADELADVSASRVIDASEMVVTPGLINAHMHISYAHAVRGIFPDDLSASEYLAYVFKLQSAMTEEEEHYTSLLGVTELVKYGTTCFLDPGTTKFLGACLGVYEKSGCRVVVGDQVVDQPNPINLTQLETGDAVTAIRETIEKYNGRLDGRMRAWAMPFSFEYSSPELLKSAKRLADEHGVGLTLHHINTPGLVDYCQREHGLRPLEYLERLGILGPNVLLSHAIGLDDAEIDALARTDTKVVVCPPAALKMGHGATRRGKLPEMLARGVSAAVGSDAGNNSNLIDTMRSMYLAAVLYNDAREASGVVPAETAIEMATINGSKALGLDDQIGSIEVGKRADLVLFDTKRPEWRSLFNPVNNLVFNADGRSVHTVLVDGRIVVEGHKPTYVDEWQLIQRVQQLGEGLVARTGVDFDSRWPIV